MKVLVAACALFFLLQIVASEGPVEYAEETAPSPEHSHAEHPLSKREEVHGPLMKAILTQVDGDSTQEQKREKRTFKYKKGGGGGGSCGSGCCSGGCGGGGGSGSYSSSSSQSGSWSGGKR